MGAGGRTSTTSTMGRLAGEAVDALASFNAKKPTPKEREGTKKDPNAVQAQAVNGRLPMAEVAKHNVPEDGWVVIKGKVRNERETYGPGGRERKRNLTNELPHFQVYDVTKLAKVHPGGNVIYTQLGKDVTDVFSVFHDPHTWKLLKEMYVADLEPVEPTTVEEKKQNELLEDFRKMRMDMIRDGLFESNKWYYVLKVMTNVSILVASIACIYRSCSWTSLLTSSFLLGLFWQQCGWLAHDFLHHQVFKSRKLNDYVGLVLGNVAQGFSSSWWKDKHNTHHAAPNELDGEHYAVDPDIDTLPLIAWSKEMLDTLETRGEQALVAVQHYLFFPILFFARMSWAQQSLAFAADSKVLGRRRSIEESSLLLLHYVWYFGVSFSALPFLKACAFVLLCQLFSGVLLSIVFVQSHNAKEVYADSKDFVSAQVVSTRDVDGGVFNDWFTGGLNRQIEHHLFPTMPRHNLGKAQGRVREFCLKHGLVYEECSMLSATCKVMILLKDVAGMARERLQKEH